MAYWPEIVKLTIQKFAWLYLGCLIIELHDCYHDFLWNDDHVKISFVKNILFSQHLSAVFANEYVELEART